MLTHFGKSLRRLRIERDERLLDMAANLGVSPAFLSNLEHGRKSPPENFDDRVIDAYALVGASADLMRKSYDQTRKTVSIETQEGLQRETVAMFARSISMLDEDQLSLIQNVLNGESK